MRLQDRFSLLGQLVDALPRQPILLGQLRDRPVLALFIQRLERYLRPLLSRYTISSSSHLDLLVFLVLVTFIIAQVCPFGSFFLALYSSCSTYFVNLTLTMPK